MNVTVGTARQPGVVQGAARARELGLISEEVGEGVEALIGDLTGLGEADGMVARLRGVASNLESGDRKLAVLRLDSVIRTLQLMIEQGKLGSRGHQLIQDARALITEIINPP